MSSDELKALRTEAWREEEMNYIQIGRSRKKNAGKICVCNEDIHEMYTLCIPDTDPFQKGIIWRYTKFPIMNRMNSSVENKDDLEDLEEIAELNQN